MSVAAEEEFMKLGVQYITPRLGQVHWEDYGFAAILYHRSIEMFFKAGLSRCYTLDALKKKKFGHRLVPI